MSDLNQTASSTQSPSPINVEAKNNNGNGKKIAIACCLIIVVLCCLCAGTMALIFGSTVAATSAVITEVQNSIGKLCTGVPQDVRSFYQNATSKDFKAVTSEREFENFIARYGDIIIDCNGVKDNTFVTSKLNGSSVDFRSEGGSDVLSIRYPSGQYNVFVQFVSESGNWKVNSIKVE